MNSFEIKTLQSVITTASEIANEAQVTKKGTNSTEWRTVPSEAPDTNVGLFVGGDRVFTDSFIRPTNKPNTGESEMNTTDREQVQDAIQKVVSDTKEKINPLIAVYVVILENFTNHEIAALKNGISGFGSIGKSNLGYEKAIEAGLASAEGIPKYKDELLEALSIEISDRIKHGRFN